MTSREAATYLRLPEHAVLDSAARGELPAQRAGDAWLFTRTDLDAWARQHPSVARPVALVHLPLRAVLRPERVLLLDCAHKEEALDALLDCLSAAPEIGDAGELARQMYEREQLMSTGIGMGIGVPHVRLESVSDLVMAVGINRRPLHDYASIDERPVEIICMIAAHADQHAPYLKILAALSGILKQARVREALVKAPDARSAYDLLTEGN